LAKKNCSKRLLKENNSGREKEISLYTNAGGALPEGLSEKNGSVNVSTPK